MDEQYLEVHQTRHGPPTPYEVKLAAAIEEIFGRGEHDLPGLVAGLNAAGLVAPDGKRWSVERFVEQFASLGG
jgi:hypothetical protein